MGASVVEKGNVDQLLHAGIAVGAGGLFTAILLGFAANGRAAGLGVAPSLASNPLHFRALVLLFYGCVALILSILWARLDPSIPVAAGLRSRVGQTLILCCIGPLLLLVVNYVIVTGIAPNYIALLPALIPVAVAFLYTIVVHRLSGVTGVGLDTRIMLRNSYLWLLVAAGLHLIWTTARISSGRPDLLWFVEQPALAVAMIGFAITASLGVLLSSVNSVYHSRDMAQMLMGTQHIYNALTALWGGALLWSLRFPGGYQDLGSAVVGIALLLLLATIANSSGLIDLRNAPWRNKVPSGGEVWADRLASMVMLLVLITGVLLGISGVVLVASGEEHPPLGLLTAQVTCVGLGVAPLAIGAGLAPIIGRREKLLVVGGGMMSVGVLAATVLWSVEALLGGSVTGLILSAEIVIGIGLMLMAVAARSASLSAG